MTFVDNAALLLALSLISSNIQFRWLKNESLKRIFLGLIYGLFAATAMRIPMELEPGVIFDGRSVILSLAGLFGGSLTTCIACLIAAVARWLLGGSGSFTGIGSVIISGIAGLLFRIFVDARKMKLGLGKLWLFGFLVHLILIVWFFTLPFDTALNVIKYVAPPYLLVFPLATMLIGGFMEDQRERIEMEQNLAESEKRYRDLVQTLNEGVWVIDPQAKTVFVNPKMAGMLGYRMDEMQGKSVYDFAMQKDHPHLNKLLDRRQQGINEQHEFIFLHKDGSQVFTLVGGTPLFDEQGEYQGALAGVQDISELKKVQAKLENQSKQLEHMVENRTRELKDAQAQLIQAERLAALGEVAGSVGHELRNPLAVISNSIFLLKNYLPEVKDPVKEYLEMIEKETRSASQIINDLLDYSRIQPGQDDLVNLPAVISEVLQKCSLPQNVSVKNQISVDIPVVRANQQQLEQIFLNLITNACEAMPQGGDLLLKSSMRKGALSISIQDSGVGIAKENLGRVFQPLYTTKARGVGLGLAITKKLADLNNITIRLQSKVGVGTTFLLDFTLLKSGK